MGTQHFEVREYSAGSYMNKHGDGYGDVNDGNSPAVPLFTALMYFNDEYVGGEISFPDESVKVKPKAGSVLIFPSKTEHEVKLVVEGNRYLVNTYMYEREYKSYS
jgi:predicted 2-oxoglutarate/Fe(II)-dependent dioxygenase YbiX